MDSLPEFVGTVHIFLGPYRGNPIALYLRRDETTCHISPRMYPWNKTVGTGENPNKAAADFEAKWKKNDLSEEMYSGPHWEGGIKPEKPKPPPKPAAKPPTPVASDAAKPDTPAATPKASSPTPDAPQVAKEDHSPTPDLQPPKDKAGAPPSSSTAPTNTDHLKAAKAVPTPSPETT